MRTQVGLSLSLLQVLHQCIACAEAFSVPAAGEILQHRRPTALTENRSVIVTLVLLCNSHAEGGIPRVLNEMCLLGLSAIPMPRGAKHQTSQSKCSAAAQQTKLSIKTRMIA